MADLTMCARLIAARLAVSEQHLAGRNIGMNMNWLEGMDHGMGEAGRPKIGRASCRERV